MIAIPVKDEQFIKVCRAVGRAEKFNYSGRNVSRNYLKLLSGFLVEKVMADFLDIPYMLDVQSTLPYDFLYADNLKLDVKSYSVYDIEMADKKHFLVEGQQRAEDKDAYIFAIYEIKTSTVYYVGIMHRNTFKAMARYVDAGESIIEGYKPLRKGAFVISFEDVKRYGRPEKPHYYARRELTESNSK